MDASFLYTVPTAIVSFTSCSSTIFSPVGHLTEQHKQHLSASRCISVSARAKIAPQINSRRRAPYKKAFTLSTRYIPSQLKRSRPPLHAISSSWIINDSATNNLVFGRSQRAQASTGNGALLALESDVTTDTTVEQIGLAHQVSLSTELPTAEADGRFDNLLRVAKGSSSQKNGSGRPLPSQSPVNGTSAILPDTLPVSGISEPHATPSELPIGELPHGGSPAAPAVSSTLLDSPIPLSPDTNVKASSASQPAPSPSPSPERPSQVKSADTRGGRNDVWRPPAPTRKFSWREFRGTQHPVQRKKHSQNMVPPRVYGMAQEVGRMWAEQKEIQLDSWKPSGGELAEVVSGHLGWRLCFFLL